MNTSSNKTVLLADDDATIRFVVAKALGNAGFTVRSTDNPSTLLKWVEKGEGDVVLSDVHMGREDIFEYLPKIKAARTDLPIVIISANTSVMTALKSRKAKVFEYIPKPFDLESLSEVIKRATHKQAPKSSKAQGNRKKTIDRKTMIGKSKAMQPVFRDLAVFSDSDVNVLIYGDAGTGKTLSAHFLHELSDVKARELVAFHPDLSLKDLAGQAEGATFLVERLDELSGANQLKIINIIDEAAMKFAAKPRVIATSTLSAQELLENPAIRNDLASYFTAGQIALPPLSKRIDDIDDLVEHFLNTNPKAKSKTRQKISASGIKFLKAHNWSGNVRELELTIQKLALTFADALISTDMVRSVMYKRTDDAHIHYEDLGGAGNMREHCRHLLLSKPITGHDSLYLQALAWVEKPLIEEALNISGGNNSKAAKLLGIHRNTLRTKIKSLNIEAVPASNS